MKKVIVISVLLLIILGSISAWASDTTGDEKIRETEKRIKEEKEKAEKEDDEEEHRDGKGRSGPAETAGDDGLEPRPGRAARDAQHNSAGPAESRRRGVGITG